MGGKDWIKTLKAGDRVIVSNYSGQNARVESVDKVTPTGLVKIGSSCFNQNGYQRSKDRWAHSFLAEATPEAIQKIHKETVNE